MGTEGNTTHSSRISEYGVLEQYLGFQIGDATNVSRNPVFEPTVTSETMHPVLPANTFDKSLTPTNTHFSTALMGSQTVQLQKGPLQNLVSVSGAQHANWGESSMADSSSRTDTSTDMEPDDKDQRFDMGQSGAVAVSDSSGKSKEKSLDQKTLRRLAQNREAARKSRLRKKAYVQQLENSRLKLTQLEQELQRARQQGIFVSSAGDQSNAGSGNGAMAFDVEHARWLEEQNRLINELRTAVNSHASDPELRTIVDNVIEHFNDIFRLKSKAAKGDVFHLLSGMWKSPAERCFMWIGGFRPSELLKGKEALQQSLAETLATGSSGPEGPSGNVANYMGQMAMAMGKLETLENFLRQADNTRQQTLQEMHRILTTRQSARALLLMNDYFSRLRALSSLWLARPQE
ncbi:TGACG-sequence-specific DNA-binding protein TGA-2.1-like isoform X2 [Olea europaea var. sylvestris]|uniref:TGACG-sequence-specific DNA-binding protein TGA-2.1-like isoform X2 n=1 Tax=Olea europaea var. sylvestris TaxID=158386 RepID=UPI000C1D7620|nr:TGACG-sequence-specific DNA-binding protein TGA-2.1-like isoform X2 [Olea europaea var. sylvestris]